MKLSITCVAWMYKVPHHHILVRESFYCKQYLESNCCCQSTNKIQIPASVQASWHLSSSGLQKCESSQSWNQLFAIPQFQIRKKPTNPSSQIQSKYKIKSSKKQIDKKGAQKKQITEVRVFVILILISSLPFLSICLTFWQPHPISIFKKKLPHPILILFEII